MFDLGWRLPNIEVTETLLAEASRFDGGDDVRETEIGNILIEAVPTTNYLVQVGPQIIDGGSAIDTAVSSQYYYVRASGGSPIYNTDRDPDGTTSATGALWLWDAHRRLGADRAEVQMAVDCREAPDGVGLPTLLERVAWRGLVWEVVEIDTDAEYPIDTTLVLARPASLLTNWYPNLA